MSETAPVRQRRSRDPKATREAILEAAGARLAQDGPEGLSLSEVAHLAGVNRGTAYQHFATRDKLVEATVAWASEQIYRAVFGDPDRPRSVIEGQEVIDMTDRLVAFAMEKPDLCRIWLMQVLASGHPGDDLFWREYEGALARFAATDFAQPGIDHEVLTVIVLAGAFLWPIWARALADGGEQRSALANRFAQETLRLSMHGTLRAERYPEIRRRLQGSASAPAQADEPPSELAGGPSPEPRSDRPVARGF
jgi:AcrR family transcriptional regulator